MWLKEVALTTAIEEVTDPNGPPYLQLQAIIIITRKMKSSDDVFPKSGHVFVDSTCTSLCALVCRI